MRPALPGQPLGRARRHHRQVALAADQELGGLDHARAAGISPARPSSPMPMTVSQGGSPASCGCAGERVDRGGGEGAAAAPAAQGDERRPAPCAISASFDSAAPTKPTGKPRITAGTRRPGVEQLEQAEQRRRRVADGDHGARQPLAPSDRRRPPSGSSPAARRFGDARLGQRADDRVAAGSRARMMPAATISLSTRIGAPARQRLPAGRRRRRRCQARSATMPGSPAAWISRTASGSRSAGTPSDRLRRG